MDFSSVLSQLANGKAAKTPSMNGYVKREDYENNSANAALFASSNNDVVEAVYKITFVENPSRTGSPSPTSYEFTARSIRRADGTLDRVVFDLADTDTMSVDAEFLRLMASREWDVADLAVVQEAITARITGRW
jgi:hypothetical protein